MKDRIEIQKELIPYTFDILLADEMFNIRVDYNSVADTFVLALYKNGEIICAGEPLTYGVPLWKDVYMCGKYPELEIIPLDESGESNAVTWDNFNSTVFLTINNGEETLN